MKKRLLSTFILGLILGNATLLSAKAITQNTQERGFISVSTTANKEIEPDVADISFAVKTTDTKSLQKATQLNKEISDKLLSNLSNMLNVSQGDYIKTSNYNAAPIYIHSGNKKTLEKYEVSNRVVVHTKSLETLGKMIDTAIDSGATNVDSLNFSLSSYDNLCNDLLGTAAQKAQTKAKILAKNLGSDIDGVKSVNVSCSTNNYTSPRFYTAKNILSAVADDTSAEAVQTQISGGVIKVNANVNASFYVK